MEKETKEQVDYLHVEEPKDAPQKVLSKEDWEELLNKLANPKCKAKGCYGRGFTGWNTITNLPERCTAKGCSERKLYAIQRQQKIANLRKKQEEAKENLKVVKESEENNESR